MTGYGNAMGNSYGTGANYASLLQQIQANPAQQQVLPGWRFVPGVGVLPMAQQMTNPPPAVVPPGQGPGAPGGVNPGGPFNGGLWERMVKQGYMGGSPMGAPQMPGMPPQGMPQLGMPLSEFASRYNALGI